MVTSCSNAVEKTSEITRFDMTYKILIKFLGSILTRGAARLPSKC